MGAGERAALSVLLGSDARIGARSVDERHEGEAVPLRELHQPDRLAIALRMRGAEVAVQAVLQVASLLVADETDRAAVEAADPGDDRGIVGPCAVAVKLHPVLE